MNTKNDHSHHHSHHHHLAHHHSSHHSNGLSALNGLTQSNGIIPKLYNLTNSSLSNQSMASYGQQSSLLQNGSSNLNNQNSSSTYPSFEEAYSNVNPYNSNNNNNNNNSNNNNGYSNKSAPQPNWYDIEIKGMVKNISPKLWQWTHLKCLWLNDNNLVRLPPVISNLVNLQCLDLSNNKLRTLPAEIGDMTSLRELYLNNNQLRLLPFELGKLFKLIQLGLKGNPLTVDIMQVYSEPNGTQKLLISLLDQLNLTCSPPPRRPWMILAEPTAPQNSIFTTMCYNVLCDKYATRQFYGYCPSWALSWEHRKKLILEDIRNFNADIIALQELETEQFYHYFLPELKQYDYDGIFSPKSRAKTMSEHDKKHVDGCAIFFKTSKFQLVKNYLIEFNQIAMATAEGSEDMLNRVMTKDNIGLAALLELKQDELNSSDIMAKTKDQSLNKQLLLVSTAHIHWDPDYCDVKLIQTLMLTNELKMIIEQATKDFLPHKISNQQIDCSSTIPVLICADLNSLPDSGVIEYLRTGRILANHIDFKDLGYETCLQKINTSDKPSELSHNLRFDCAYEKDLMPYTNYTYDFKGMIDYIFYSRNLMRTVGLLGPMDTEWIKANKIVGFPHPHVPSDHLPLMVELELLSSNYTNSNQNNNYMSSSHHSSSYNSSLSSSNLNRSSSQHSHSNNSHHSANSQLGLGQMIPINPNGNSTNSLNNSNSNNNNFNNYIRK